MLSFHTFDSARLEKKKGEMEPIAASSRLIRNSIRFVAQTADCFSCEAHEPPVAREKQESVCLGGQKMEKNLMANLIDERKFIVKPDNKQHYCAPVDNKSNLKSFLASKMLLSSAKMNCQNFGSDLRPSLCRSFRINNRDDTANQKRSSDRCSPFRRFDSARLKKERRNGTHSSIQSFDKKLH
ncbi:hypothetical protein CEXT_734311 [Caerostris extrusa]|uniref:Uncharacterized protein n=1 Tax=Caerostris extrusa TaxID=172846 RepID=A0AAV4UXK6_CAEEX|nr:hypothetical protein CEXT_734311 [Caerostris extrusa]